MKQHKLKIEYLNVDELTPYENNARKHDDDDVSMIENSIEQFDFNDPIGVWGENNIIVEGHGRLLAAKQAGLTEVPCIRLDHLTEEQRKAYTLAHNKTAENSSWDPDMLEKELASIPDIDMSDFGFDLGEDFSPDDFGEDFSLPDGDKPEMCTMTFTLHAEQKSLIEYAMSLVTDDVKETFGNTNKNGNALYEVVRQWAEQRK